MKKLLTLSLMVGLIGLISCSSDDPPPTEPPGVKPDTVKAVLSTTAPSMTTTDDVVWMNATQVTIKTAELSFKKVAKQSGSTAAAAAGEVGVQAIVHNNQLYLRLAWDDPTNDLWLESWLITGRDTAQNDWILFKREHILEYAEDEIVVMFENSTAQNWDAWYWRSLTTGGIGFGEGNTLQNNTLVLDNTDLADGVNLVHDNANIGNSQPAYVHEDSSAYTGHILYTQPQNPLTTGTLADPNWSIGQRIPGWRIDSSFAGASKATLIGSRWDIRSVDRHTGSGYTLVLQRDLNTGFGDDLDISSQSSIKMRLAVCENRRFNLNSLNTSQKLSGEFTLTLP